MNIELENLKLLPEIVKELMFIKKQLGNSSSKRWLNVSETALYLGYSKDYIHKLKDSQFIESIHFYKKTGKLLFDSYELDKWVTASHNKLDSKAIAKNVLKDLI